MKKSNRRSMRRISEEQLVLEMEGPKEQIKEN